MTTLNAETAELAETGSDKFLGELCALCVKTS